MKKDILSLKPAELTDELLSIGEPAYRARQIFDWLHVKRAEKFSCMTNLSANLREKLDESFEIREPVPVRRLASQKDKTVKYLFELYDGEHIETVKMEYEHGISLCISTQVGCKMGCRFCASTIAGFKRSLTAGEMLSQIYAVEKLEKLKVGSVVLMGIGEPMDNFDEVVRFLELVSDKAGKNLSQRHISVSTCGVVPRIRELAELKTGITLSVSLHAADDITRSRLMPINERYPLCELIPACKEYFNKTGRRISFEYSVIDGVNGTASDAKKLCGLLGGFNCHINIIPVNKIAERSFTSSRAAAQRFKKMLTDLGLNATVRRTLGDDINAACGQLRRQQERG